MYTSTSCAKFANCACLLLLLPPQQAVQAQTTCGSLITYRQFSTILSEAPQCLSSGCNSSSDLTSISSQCRPNSGCSSIWELFSNNFQQNWCSSCKSDVACRISGWPILNVTASCESIPHDWLFYVDGGCCISGNETFELASWVGRMCNRTQWREQFQHYDGMAKQDWAEWIRPWNWTVQSKNSTRDLQPIAKDVKCKAPSTYLGLFFIDSMTAMAVTVISAIFKTYLIIWRRNGAFDWFLARKPSSGPGSVLQVAILGIATAGIQVGLNFVNAYRVHRHPGYDQVPVLRLGLLYCSRPTLNWLPISIALVPDFILRVGENSDAPLIWAHVAWTAAVSEVFIQGFASVSLWIAVDMARRRHFYIPRKLHRHWDGRPMVRMYVGALFWVLGCIVIITFWVITCWLLIKLIDLINRIRNTDTRPSGPSSDPQGQGFLDTVIELVWTNPKKYVQSSRPFQATLKAFKESPAVQWGSKTIVRGRYAPWIWLPAWQKEWGENHPFDIEKRARQWNDDTKSITLGFAVLLGVFNYAAQWLFWDGYVKSKSFGYCPPETELPIIYTLWNISSVIAIFITFFFN